MNVHPNTNLESRGGCPRQGEAQKQVNTEARGSRNAMSVINQKGGELKKTKKENERQGKPKKRKSKSTQIGFAKRKRGEKNKQQAGAKRRGTGGSRMSTKRGRTIFSLVKA